MPSSLNDKNPEEYYKDKDFHERLKADWPTDPKQLHAGGWEMTDGMLGILETKAAGSGHVRLLDLCCGEGSTAIHIGSEKKYSNWDVVGIDISKFAIDEANAALKRSGAARVSFVCGSALELPFKAGEFDLILGQDPDILAHDGRRACMAECFRTLKSGGYFAFHHHWIPGRSWTVQSLQQYCKDAGASMETNADAYIADLEKVGFVITQVEDIHDVAEKHLKGQLVNMKARMKESGGEVQPWLLATVDYIEKGFKFGVKVVAQKPVE